MPTNFIFLAFYFNLAKCTYSELILFMHVTELTRFYSVRELLLGPVSPILRFFSSPSRPFLFVRSPTPIGERHIRIRC